MKRNFEKNCNYWFFSIFWRTAALKVTPVNMIELAYSSKKLISEPRSIRYPNALSHNQGAHRSLFYFIKKSMQVTYLHGVSIVLFCFVLFNTTCFYCPSCCKYKGLQNVIDKQNGLYFHHVRRSMQLQVRLHLYTVDVFCYVYLLCSVY